jgi:hypothetical protein
MSAAAAAERAVINAHGTAEERAKDLDVEIDYGFATEKFHLDALPASRVDSKSLTYLEFDSIHEVNGYLAALQHVRDGMVRIRKPPTTRRAKKPKRKH